MGAVVPECGVDFGEAALEIDAQPEDIRTRVLRANINPLPRVRESREAISAKRFMELKTNTNYRSSQNWREDSKKINAVTPGPPHLFILNDY